MIKNIPCIILSGGKSLRMGEDKSLLSFGGCDTLIEYQYSKLSKIFSDVYISSKDDKVSFLSLAQKNKVFVLDDEKKESSPMIALQTIFKKLQFEKVFIITVDVPLLKKETILELVKGSDEYEIQIARDSEFIHNLCGVFDRNLLRTIDKCIKKNIHNISFLIQNAKTHYIRFSDNRQFININTSREYKQALRIHKNL
jgi:molybdopterin-guanine dinucleotide biosynthesis protein A